MSFTPAEAQVAQLLQRLAGYAETGAAEPGVDDLRPRRQRPGWMPRAAAVILVLALAGVSFALREEHRGQVVTTGEVAAAGKTERLAASGLAGRTGAASAWTGDELLVWGGQTLVDGTENVWLADGAALDPVANRWRSLPPAPLSARSDPASVWTGTEMLVFGGADATHVLTDGAAYNPRTGRWRTIASQSFAHIVRPAAVWTGTEMLAVSSVDGLSTSAYDPKADRWRALAAPPGAPVMPYPQIVWTGTQAVLVLWPTGPRGTGLAFGPPSSPPVVAEPPSSLPARPPATPPGPPPPPPDLSSLGPVVGPNGQLFVTTFSPAADRWDQLPAVALRDGSLPRLVWTGEEVLALETTQAGAAYDFGRRTWRPLAPMPAQVVLDVDPVWTGRLALFWAGGDVGRAYDPATDTWKTFDAGGLRLRADPVVAWAGDALVGWSGFNNLDTGSGRLESDGIRFRPAAS